MLPRGRIPGESATALELRIACEGGEERLGRIEAMFRTAGRTASSFLSHLNTAIHEDPDDVAQVSGRAGVLRRNATNQARASQRP